MGHSARPRPGFRRLLKSLVAPVDDRGLPGFTRHPQPLLLALAVLVLCAACGIARPDPAVQNVAARPDTSTVLLFGDSLLVQAAPEIALQAEANGLPVDVVDRAQNGAGLLTSHGFGAPPREILQAHLAEFEPDYVVIEFSGNFWFENILPGYEDLEYGSEEWFAAWRENYDLIVADILAAGAQPLTVIPPPYGPGSPGEATRTALAEGYPAAAATHGSPTIDWQEALASKDCVVWIADSSGRLHDLPLCYADDLQDVEAGDIETVRAEDMLHLSESGAQRAALWTVAALSDLLA